jgi:DNA-directed RNA polymerase subunit RPC12/RpoP
MGSVVALRHCSKCGDVNTSKQKSYCARCWAAYTAAQRAKNPELAKQYWKKSHSEIIEYGLTRSRVNELNNKYGISGWQYNQLLIKQGNSCAICNTLFDPSNRKLTPHVDHDPRTQQVRGLLCQRCNIDIHRFDKEPTWLPLALKYLRKRR